MNVIKKKTVLLALSGGVDSSVAAYLLKKQGYQVIAAFMKNFSETKNKITGECAWKEERRIAQRIAAKLGIPFITLDFEKEYKKYVINPMFKDYARGLTPNPDILCNKIIKFPLLWKKAQKLKADYIATGHYARIRKNHLGFQLLEGKDKTKDQSYFLYQLSQADLSHSLFPMGNYKKEQTRKIAKSLGFPNWNKHGTCGICFVGKIPMKPFLQQKIKEKKGKVFTPEGKLIGFHPGTSYFTIGQRIGPRLGFQLLKEAGNQKLYVAEKRKNNILIVATKTHPLLKKSQVLLKSLHLISPKEKIPKKLKARIRHLGKLIPGTLKKQNNHYSFNFHTPVSNVAEGQSLVLYHKDEVIGGGEIRLK